MAEAILSLEQAKAWLRVDFDEDDELIRFLVDEATGLVETRLRRPVIGDDDEAVCKDAASVPKTIIGVVQALISLKYEHRDATSDDVGAILEKNAGLDRWINWEA